MTDVLILTQHAKLSLACVSDSDLIEYWEENHHSAKWEKEFVNSKELSDFLERWYRKDNPAGPGL